MPATAGAEPGQPDVTPGAPVTDRMAAAEAGAWEEWYLDADDGCTLYVREEGSGQPLVVLHGGWGAEHGYLTDAFAGLEQEYRLVYYDQRGSLRSPCPDSLISIDQHVRDLDRLRQELGLEDLLLVGHSMGTYLAMAYLDAHAARVQGMVLLGAMIPRSPEDPEEVALYRQQEEAFVAFAQASQTAQVQREGLDRDHLTDRERTRRWRIGYASGNIYHIERWRQMTGGMVFYNPDAGRAAGLGMQQGWNFVPALAAFARPVTVINGDHDLVGFGGELHRRMLAELPNFEFVMLEDAGHNAWIDQPQRFRQELMRALGKYR